jgi:hypothetical protein
MPEWEQKLVKDYAPKIAGGEHVIPTQLRQIVGMKNAFEKVTAVVDSKSNELEVVHTSKHAGTLASLARDKNSRQDITDSNARQAQAWVGDKKLHCNTFNSGPIGAGNDPEIVKSTQQAMENVRGKETNTAFNAFRYLGINNDLSGAKKSLESVVGALPSKTEDKDREFDKIKSHIKPRGFFSKLFGINTAKGDFNQELKRLKDSGKIDDQTAEILRAAKDLNRSVQNADRIIRLGDAENSSLATSTKLNQLNYKINEIQDNCKNGKTEKPKNFNIDKYKEEILNMCASGKDRTGLAEHDQSAQAISNKLGIPVKDIDAQLLKSGHTAQQAGGIYAGGATIGCFGTKSENKAGLPESRKEGLSGIIEASASTNKIKGESKVKEKDVQKTASPHAHTQNAEVKVEQTPQAHNPEVKVELAPKQPSKTHKIAEHRWAKEVIEPSDSTPKRPDSTPPAARPKSQGPQVG